MQQMYNLMVDVLNSYTEVLFQGLFSWSAFLKPFISLNVFLEEDVVVFFLKSFI